MKLHLQKKARWLEALGQVSTAPGIYGFGAKSRACELRHKQVAGRVPRTQAQGKMGPRNITTSATRKGKERKESKEEGNSEPTSLLLGTGLLGEGAVTEGTVS